MKRAAACLLIALTSAGAPALAQAADDPVDRLRACSSLTESEKAKCLGRLPREIAPEPARSRAVSGSEGTAILDSWIFSETTSPIDYSPVVIASVMASGAPDGSGMKLSIACRGGNTSLVLVSPSALPAGESYTVSYIVDGGSPTTLAATAAPFGILARRAGPGREEEWVVRDWRDDMTSWFGAGDTALREVVDLDLEESFVETLRAARDAGGRAA